MLLLKRSMINFCGSRLEEEHDPTAGGSSQMR
jgi:hypothetical protein